MSFLKRCELRVELLDLRRFQFSCSGTPWWVDLQEQTGGRECRGETRADRAGQGTHRVYQEEKEKFDAFDRLRHVQ